MEQKRENLWYYDGTMINDISFQVSREVHFSHFVEYVNITRARTRTRTHVPARPSYPRTRAQAHTHTRAPLDSVRCSSTRVYDGCTHSWQVIFGLAGSRTVQYVAPRSFIDVTLFICTSE